MNLEQYRKTLRRRMCLSEIYFFVVAALSFVLNYLGSNPFNGFTMGTTCATELVIVFLVGPYITALNNDEALQKLYIQEHNERRQLIRRKTSANGISIILPGLLLAMIISSYFSNIVFFTLLGVALFIVSVMLSLMFYYHHKM